MNSKPICLVIGAGGGIGANVAKKFALEGYHACLCSSDGEEKTEGAEGGECVRERWRGLRSSV